MSHPSIHARTNPDKPAYIMANSGVSVSYAELEARSNQGAHLLRELGLQPGDHIAVLLENHPRFFDIYWAAARSGLYFTPVSTHLTAAEAAYIVNDCGARVLVSSAAQRQVAEQLVSLCPAVEVFLSVDEALTDYQSWIEGAGRQAATPIADEVGGHNMMYSSGTTGQPKGIKVPFANSPIETMVPVLGVISRFLGFDADTIYVSPAPLYHASPIGFSSTVMRLGGTVIVMEKFDPEQFMAVIQRYRATHTQVVPTMFVRLLKLPEEVRQRYDLSSMKCALHAAAPCPVSVKDRMIEWWGPVIYEHYAGSEGSGLTMIAPHDWLAHKGSVGRAMMGDIHIVGENGDDLPTGKAGMVYFANSRKFVYHNAPEKTQEAFNDRGWSTLGDIGYLDEEGYLYLTDRKAYMIISGGVNIYPQEAEGALTLHPKVVDVAVFGVPNAEFGEEVKAVVQPVDMAMAGPELEAELIAYCKERLAGLKCPRSIDFEAKLPRQENGKLYKRLLRDRYWAEHKNRVI
ncbi:MAG: acyl-CoA synthetase [Janthinobacterium lividum]